MTIDYRSMDVLELSCVVLVKVLGWEEDGDSMFESADNTGPVEWFSKGDPLSYIQFPADSLDACRKAELKIKEMGLGSEYVNEMHILATEEGFKTRDGKDLFLITASANFRCIAMLRLMEVTENENSV